MPDAPPRPAPILCSRKIYDAAAEAVEAFTTTSDSAGAERNLWTAHGITNSLSKNEKLIFFLLLGKVVDVEVRDETHASIKLRQSRRNTMLKTWSRKKEEVRQCNANIAAAQTNLPAKAAATGQSPKSAADASVKIIEQ